VNLSSASPALANVDEILSYFRARIAFRDSYPQVVHRMWRWQCLILPRNSITDRPTELHVSIPANANWVDTGFPILAGDAITIEATGEWTAAAGGLVQSPTLA